VPELTTAAQMCPQAPAWTTTAWLNGDPRTAADLRGRVVVVEAFQMLCPGCVSGALPQAQRVRHTFGQDVDVIGLHTVFEHHEAMTPTALRAFVHEYRLGFPIGIDAHDDHGRPVTFGAYRMRGTPTTVLIDRAGRLRSQHFGNVEDMRLAAEITTLLCESDDATGDRLAASLGSAAPDQACTVGGGCG